MPQIADIPLTDERATRALGARLAAVLFAGDTILLRGDLGAGKTTLVRGLVQHFTPHIDVQSPTFTFVETYETSIGPLWHFDLYRVEDPDEVFELGLEDALNDGVTIIEWPERAAMHLPAGALTITLVIDDTGRTALLTGSESWKKRLVDLNQATGPS